MGLLGFLVLCTALSLPAETTPAAQEKDQGKKIASVLPYPLHLNQPLIVGVCETPPFAFRDANGEWTGVTIDLWEAIAKKINAKYSYKPMDLGELIAAVQNKQVDVAATALTINLERARTMDLTHTYYGSGLGIATTLANRTDLWGDLFSRVFTWNFLKALLALSAVLLVTGLLIWLLERKHNPDQFGHQPFKGLSDGFWWLVGWGFAGRVFVGLRLVSRTSSDVFWIVSNVRLFF